MELLTDQRTAVGDLAAEPGIAVRQALRGQIAHLERQIASIVATTYPRLALEPDDRRAGVPRLLDTAELERRRDGLAGRYQALSRVVVERERQQQHARELLAKMVADPDGHRWLRITNAELGEPGCTVHESRPKLGILGMLMGWWRVKVSSGCP